MPNRIIKESICYSEDIDKLSPEEEVFFYRLIVNCDDYGRLDSRIPMLKSRLYPLKDHMKSSDIKRYLMKLSEIKPEPLVILYEKSGIQYLQMTKWDKHQQVRAKRSKYPAFEDADVDLKSCDINCNQMNAYVPENPNPNPNPNPIRESIPEKTAFEKAIDDFGEFRKKIKKPLTDRAKQLLICELDKLASDDNTKIEIINQSIVNGWQGVFPLKKQSQQNSNPFL